MASITHRTSNLTASTPRKRGRHTGCYHMADGTQIEGLVRQKNGRWRISATGERFREPNELKAVARFQETMAKLKGNPMVSLPLGPQPGPEAARAAAIATGGSRLQAKISRDGKGGVTVEYSVVVGSPAFYAAVAEMLTGDPKDLAIKTGVEWVARGAGLPKPEPSPKMSELIETYKAKLGVTDEEKQRCKRFWNEFTKCVGVNTLRELTHDLVTKYEKQLADDPELASPKSIKHRYTRIRTIIAYAMKRGKSPDDCQRALNILKMLEVPAANTLDPQPISAEDFWAIHAQAVKAHDSTFAALMLFSLNAALYPSEVGAVRWADVELDRGEFSSQRNKTKVPRVACLWPETVAALEALPHGKETIFNTSRQRYTRMSVHREWSTYRDAANKPKVLFNQIRDAAFTIACRLDLNQARVLAGHRLPGSVDHYVRRNPNFVADACKAIHESFFARRPRPEARTNRK